MLGSIKGRAEKNSLIWMATHLLNDEGFFVEKYVN
jgi:hypothetical protein